MQKPPKPPRKPRNENWVGVNLLNRIGALLIVIGAVATAAHDGFPEWVRSLILFLFALAVVGFGEFLNRKKTTVASIGVSATGVALMYVTIAASYFGLHTIGTYAALISCVAVTVLGVYLATRYNAQIIGVFALIGGYLPIFALDSLDNPIVIGLVAYLVLLSVFSLTIALMRKWSVMNIFGFVLTVFGTLALGWQIDATIALAYAGFAFVVYTALPLVAAYGAKEKLGTLDLTLVILNTFISSIVILAIASRLDIENLHSWLCAGFAAFYVGLAFVAKRVFDHSILRTIFELSAVGFCILFVPFFFEPAQFTLAWTIQGIILAAGGILNGKKLAEYSGIGILAWSFIFLFTHDLLAMNDLFAPFMLAPQFTFNFAFLTTGMTIVFASYLVKDRHRAGYGQAHKILTFITLWIFAMYMIFRYVPRYLPEGWAEYITPSLWAVKTFAIAFIYAKVKLWSDVGTKILANIMHFIGIVGLFFITVNLVEPIVVFGRDILNANLISVLVAQMIGFTAVLIYHMTEKRNAWTVSYKNINIVSLLLSVMMVAGGIFNDFFGIQPMLIMFLFVVAIAITRIPAIRDTDKGLGVKTLAIIAHLIGLLWLFGFNSMQYQNNVWQLLAINGAAQIVAMIAINDLFNLFSAKMRENPVKIVILSAYFLIVTTQTMMVQGDIAFYSAVISIMYAVLALAWIVLGFALRNKVMRLAGLFLSMAAVAKLLIIDVWGASSEMRIISLVSLGVILITISLVYNKLSKVIAEPTNDEPHEE
ncbi:MAG: DUF2339 domain-containing protein [Oscillospiraceae bacterium]|nr:DUF2339 domain-containing protein [Oscillospiraceae bacterium]